MASHVPITAPSSSIFVLICPFLAYYAWLIATFSLKHTQLCVTITIPIVVQSTHKRNFYITLDCSNRYRFLRNTKITAIKWKSNKKHWWQWPSFPIQLEKSTVTVWNIRVPTMNLCVLPFYYTFHICNRVCLCCMTYLRSVQFTRASALDIRYFYRFYRLS